MLLCYLNWFLLSILLYCAFLLLFLIVDLYFLIPAVFAPVFNPTAELTMPIGIPAREAKTKIETHPVTTKAKINKCLTYFKAFQTFFCFFYSSIHFNLFPQ